MVIHSPIKFNSNPDGKLIKNRIDSKPNLLSRRTFNLQNTIELFLLTPA